MRSVDRDVVMRRIPVYVRVCVFSVLVGGGASRANMVNVNSATDAVNNF